MIWISAPNLLESPSGRGPPARNGAFKQERRLENHSQIVGSWKIAKYQGKENSSDTQGVSVVSSSPSFLLHSYTGGWVRTWRKRKRIVHNFHLHETISELSTTKAHLFVTSSFHSGLLPLCEMLS